jgi:hypothetical protein
VLGAGVGVAGAGVGVAGAGVGVAGAGTGTATYGTAGTGSLLPAEAAGCRRRPAIQQTRQEVGQRRLQLNERV